MRTEVTTPVPVRIDPYAPGEIAHNVAAVGVAKARLDALSTVALAVLAGAFIALGAQFSTVASTGAAGGFGPSRVLAGVAFSLGLILVVVAGAELFTGNNLIVMAWASGQVTTAQLLRNWGLVYLGNFVGAVGTALLVYLSGQWRMDGGAVGATTVAIATAKVTLAPAEAFFRGVLCNALVCLAVWLSYSARTTTDKILAVVPPIAAFVAGGFEHSVANMYFVPLGMLVATQASMVGAADVASLRWESFLLHNLLPVTLGNVVGGGVLVGAVYWLVYLRPSRRRAGAAAPGEG